MNTSRIGLVGVGLMGHGIALNIARKGHAQGAQQPCRTLRGRCRC